MTVKLRAAAGVVAAVFTLLFTCASSSYAIEDHRYDGYFTSAPVKDWLQTCELYAYSKAYHKIMTVCDFYTDGISIIDLVPTKQHFLFVDTLSHSRNMFAANAKEGIDFVSESFTNFTPSRQDYNLDQISTYDRLRQPICIRTGQSIDGGVTYAVRSAGGTVQMPNALPDKRRTYFSCGIADDGHPNVFFLDAQGPHDMPASTPPVYFIKRVHDGVETIVGSLDTHKWGYFHVSSSQEFMSRLVSPKWMEHVDSIEILDLRTGVFSVFHVPDGEDWLDYDPSTGTGLMSRPVDPFSNPRLRRYMLTKKGEKPAIDGSRTAAFVHDDILLHLRTICEADLATRTCLRAKDAPIFYHTGAGNSFIHRFQDGDGFMVQGFLADINHVVEKAGVATPALSDYTYYWF